MFTFLYYPRTLFQRDQSFVKSCSNATGMDLTGETTDSSDSDSSSESSGCEENAVSFNF